MQHPQFDGVILEDKWGKTYLCSNCLFAYSELGDNTLWHSRDKVYASYFLHDLQPEWNQRQIWANIYRQARPWHSDLSGLTDFQLRDSLIHMLANDEIRLWQLTEGWGQPPEENGIGDGGLAPATSSAPPPLRSTPKRQGGADTNAVPQPPSSKKVEPKSLEHAQQILAERRKQIEQSGYQQKYSDAELLAIAKAGDIAGDRFHVRLVFNNPEMAKTSTLGFRRNSGRAPYWATTFDMAEAADTDPELLACIFGIENYSADNEFSLVVIDTHNLPPQAERQSFVPTFENMTAFCNSEFTDEEIGSLRDTSAVLNDECAEEYADFMASYKATGQSEHDADAVKRHLKITGADKKVTERMVLRHKVQSECGANTIFSGNGLTKVNHKNRYAEDVPQQFGVAETFTFERDPLTLNELGPSVVVIPAKPLKG